MPQVRSLAGGSPLVTVERLRADHPLKNSVGAIGWPIQDGGPLTGAVRMSGSAPRRPASATNFCRLW